MPATKNTDEVPKFSQRKSTSLLPTNFHANGRIPLLYRGSPFPWGAVHRGAALGVDETRAASDCALYK